MSGAWLLALATVGVLGPPAGASLTAASILRRTSPGEQGPASAPGGLGPLRVSKRYDLDLQTCVDNFDVQRDQIIRTQDSKRMGAVNLAVKDVLTRDECLRLCCETDKCDVFVFEEKQSPGTCYMFHCGPPGDSRCKFTRHESYTTGILDMTRRILDQHEQDLNSLRILLEPTPSPLAGVRLLSSKTGPVMTAPGMASSASSSAAAAGVQTQGCSMYQFRCRHTASVECIAVYNQCDGIPQCSDRSDELSCPSEQGTTVVAPPAGDAAAFGRGVGLAQGQKLSEDLAGDSHVHAQELLDLREQQYQLQREKQQQLFQAQQPGQSLPDTKPQQPPPPPPPPEQPMNPYTYRNWQQQQPVHSVQPQQQQKQQQQIQQQQQQIQQSQESKAQQLSLSDQLGQLQLQPGSGVLRAVLPASHQTDGAGSLAVGSKASMQGPRAPSQPEQESQLPVQQRPQPPQQQQQQDILAAALQQQQQLLLQQQQLLLQQQQQQQQQLQQQMPLFQHPGAGGSGPARGAALQWDSGPYRSGAHDSHIFTHKGGVLDADHYHVRTHPHQAFGEDLQAAGAPGYGDASQAGTSYYAQGAPGGRPADEYGPARAPQRQYGAQYGAPPDYFYEDGGSESRLQLANLGRLGLQVPADDSSSRRLEADLTSVPYEKQLPQLPQSPQPGAGPAAAKQKPPPGPGAALGADAPPQPRAEAANATAAPAAPDAAPTPRPRPQDKANSVKKQLEHATERSTAPPPATGRPPGDAALKNKTDAAHPKSAAGAKKAAAAAPGLSDGNLSLEQAALVDIQDGPTVSPKGAVISLVLGLVLTSFMVVVIICRIRTIKRRLLRRGGQSPYAHDADYLVNGMYL